MVIDFLPQIISTFSGLIVALLAVWVKETWSDRRKFRSALRALQAEIDHNARSAEQLNLQIQKGLNAIEKDRVFMRPSVRLYDIAWFTFRSGGFLTRLDRDLIRNLDKTYESFMMLKDSARRQEEITFSPPSVSPKAINRMRKNNLLMMRKECENLNENLKQVIEPLEKVLDC